MWKAKIALEKEEKAAAQAQADYRSDLGPAPAQTAPRQENEPAYGHDVPTKEQTDAKERHKLLTTLCTIGGAVFLFAGFSTLFMYDADSMMEAFTAIAQMLGGGAALLWEKIVATNSNKIVWIVDESKVVDTIGKFPLPVEVIPFGAGQVVKKFEAKGYKPVLHL